MDTSTVAVDAEYTKTQKYSTQTSPPQTHLVSPLLWRDIEAVQDRGLCANARGAVDNDISAPTIFTKSYVSTPVISCTACVHGTLIEVKPVYT